MDFITSDRSLKVGDIVFCRYISGDRLFLIVDIERRFFDKDLLKQSLDARIKGCKVGDEYNPIVSIKEIADLRINPGKIKSKKKQLDASWVKKATPEIIQEHIERLNNIVKELFLI